MNNAVFRHLRVESQVTGFAAQRSVCSLPAKASPPPHGRQGATRIMWVDNPSSRWIRTTSALPVSRLTARTRPGRDAHGWCVAKQLEKARMMLLQNFLNSQELS